MTLRMLTKLTVLLTVLALDVALLGMQAGGGQARGRVLLQKQHLVYEGAFTLPRLGANMFGYGGTALTFDRATKTLLVVGHDQVQHVAEISIPQPRDPRKERPLAAELVKKFFDPTDGKFTAIGSREYAKIGGLLPWGDRLITSVFHYYDASGGQKASHFVSSRDLSVPDDAKGPFKVGSLQTGLTSGYMTIVPEAWREALGGPALVGQCCIPIISRTSYGPSAFAFDPNDVGTKTPVPATPLLYYPQENPLAAWEATSPHFNGTTKIGGLVFPDGTDSILYFGKHGTGTFCYGVKCFPGAGQSNHAPPYVSQVWAYGAADLADVRAGRKRPWSVKPYAVWTFEFPGDAANVIVEGAAYDPATQRIFLSQARGENPAVHVYRVQIPNPGSRD